MRVRESRSEEGAGRERGERERKKLVFIFIHQSFCWCSTAELIVNSDIFFIYLYISQLKIFSEFTVPDLDSDISFVFLALYSSLLDLT